MSYPGLNSVQTGINSMSKIYKRSEKYSFLINFLSITYTKSRLASNSRSNTYIHT